MKNEKQNTKMIVILGVLSAVALLLLTACASNQLPRVETQDNVVQTNNTVVNNQIKLNVKEANSEPNSESNSELNSELNSNKTETKEADIKQVFEDLVAKGESSEFKVNYQTTTNVKGQTEVIESTWFLKDKNFRMDDKGNVEGQAYESRMITSKDSAVMCNKQGSWTCFDLGLNPEDAQQEQEGQAEMMKTEDIDKDLGITAAPDKKIAGTTAKCFIVATEGASSEFCYSKEGIPLYFETNAEGEGASFIQEATSYSKKVSDSDFEPPAIVQDMQKMMNQFATK